MNRTHLALFVACLAAPAFAQPNPNDVPQVPPVSEIQARMKKIFAEAPQETLEIAGVAKLTYRRVWLDDHVLAMKFGGTLTGREQPRGQTLESYVKQFEPRMRLLLADELLDVGGLELLVGLNLKKKPIAAGKYRVGLVLQDGKPAGILLKGEKGKPISLKLKKHKVEEPPEAEKQLRLKLVEPDPQVAEQEKFDLLVRVIDADVITSGPIFQRPAPKGEKTARKDEEEDEDADAAEADKKEMDKKK